MQTEFVITAEQIENVYKVLVNRSWQNGDTFEAYQDAWNTLAVLLGIDVTTNGSGPLRPHTVPAGTLCAHCNGFGGKCQKCKGKGYHAAPTE